MCTNNLKYRDSHSGKLLARAVEVVLKEVKEARDANTDALARGFVEPKVVSCADASLEVDLNSIRGMLAGDSENVCIEFPKMQGRITQTLDFYSAMLELSNPRSAANFKPQGWTGGRATTYRHTKLLEAMERNGTQVFKMAARHRGPLSGQPVRRVINEKEWLVAIRKQLGLGMGGSVVRVGEATGVCSCGKRNQPFEGTYDQHWGSTGCKYSAGGLATRHKA